VPIPDPVVEDKRQRIILQGDVPSPANPPKGCNFSTRCPVKLEMCDTVEPDYLEYRPGHFCACHRIERELGRPAGQ
jgi:oligopeptide transport system ATP-binding protein